MKPLLSLLLGPATLGLMAPVAAAAAELKLAGLHQYGSSKDQVSSIRQFSDLRPTDWAYQALNSLIERYGCLAGYPNGTIGGTRAISRFEAAALLNACLDRIGESTDALKRLLKEFEAELALLKGRTDGLEARVGQLEATRFSTTTKLSGLATYVIGGSAFMGTNRSSADLTTPHTPIFNRANYGATSFDYDLQLSFDTSFTGKDLLRTVLRGGDSGGENGSMYSRGMLSTLEAFYEQPAGDDVFGVFQLYYNFPVGEELTFSVGPLVRTDDDNMLGLWPSVYPADTVLDFFTYAGAPGVYNTGGLGGGGGVVYRPNWAKGLSLSQNYVSAEGSSFNNNVVGNASSGNPGIGGMFSDGAGSVAITQIAYAGQNPPLIGGSYGIAFAYTYSQNIPVPVGTPLAVQFSDYNQGKQGYDSANTIGLSGYWQPAQPGLVPSISWGAGLGSYSIGATAESSPTKGVTIASWYTGLQWQDAFIKGNALGMALGQAPYVTQLGSNAADSPRAAITASSGTGESGAYDSNFMWEWWYMVRVSDHITLTPALFFISNFDGQLGSRNLSGAPGTATNSVLGGLVKTSFRF